jgi:hypothetical protein
MLCVMLPAWNAASMCSVNCEMHARSVRSTFEAVSLAIKRPAGHHRTPEIRRQSSLQITYSPDMRSLRPYDNIRHMVGPVSFFPVAVNSTRIGH